MNLSFILIVAVVINAVVAKIRIIENRNAINTRKILTVDDARSNKDDKQQSENEKKEPVPLPNQNIEEKDENPKPEDKEEEKDVNTKPEDKKEEKNTNTKPNEKEEEKASTPEKQDFQNPVYIETVDKDKLKTGFKVIEVLLTQDATEKDVFTLKDEQKKEMDSYFKITAEKKNVKIEVKTDIENEKLKDLHQSLIFLLEMKPEQSKDDVRRTTLVIFLQEKKLETPSKLTFKKPKYEINTLTEYTGIIEHFSVQEKHGDETTVKYNLVIQNDDMKNLLEIDELSGILRKTKNIKPSQYNFKILAKIDGTNVQTEADVVMTVSHVTACDSKDAAFSFAQLVKHIEEKKTGEILPAIKPIDKCVYKMIYQHPEGDFFQLDEKTGALTLKKEVERDPKLFGTMNHPKFTIELSLSCNDNPQEDKKVVDSEVKQSHYIDIPLNSQRLFVILLIDEIKKPIFSRNTITIGYPKQYDFLMQNSPPYVTSISAVSNYNDIEYSIAEQNCPFSIHPTSGNLYPIGYHSGSEDSTFTVIAKKDEKDEAKLIVTVKFLATNEIVEVFFIDTTLEDFTSILNNINSHLDIEIKSLIHAVVPITDTARDSNKALAKKNAAHLLKALCYAINKKQSVVKGDEILNKMRTNSNVFSIQIMSERKAPGKHENRESGTNYTLAICGVLVILGIVLSAIYLIFMRRKNVPILILSRRNDRSSTTPLEDDMEGPSQTRWITSHANTYNKFNQSGVNAFSNPTYENRRASYSNNNGEIVLMDNTRHVEEANLFSTGVSSFKPEAHKDISTENVNKNIYSDLEFPARNGTASTVNNDVPVLPVTSLPSISAERRRKKTNGDS